MTNRVEAQATHERIRNAEMHWARGMYAPAREEYSALLDSGSAFNPEEIGLLVWRLAYCLVMLGETAGLIVYVGIPLLLLDRFLLVRHERQQADNGLLFEHPRHFEI